jgi:23S rRNA pseudouridine1911/1915/1917 synthase
MLDILYESGPCLVVLKPAGLLTQAPPGIDSLELRAREFLKAREGKSGNIYLGVPHRLDRPVSGAVILARHVRAARRVAEQFEARTITKQYWAVVSGVVDPPAGRWTDHVAKVLQQAQAIIVPAEHPDARQAVLDYQVRGQDADHTWLQIELGTGRMHQIRVQAAARGHSVVGDAQYGSAQTFGEQFADDRLRAIALHGRRLAFQHPMTHEPVDITAPLPQAWAETFGAWFSAADRD